MIGTATIARNNKVAIKTIKRPKPLPGSDSMNRSVDKIYCPSDAILSKVPVNCRHRNINGSVITAATRLRTNSDGYFLNEKVKISVTVCRTGNLTCVLICFFSLRFLIVICKG